jgi:hypothetical protein
VIRDMTRLADCRCGAGAGADCFVKVIFIEEDAYQFCKEGKKEARKIQSFMTGYEPWERADRCVQAFKKKKQFETGEC